VTEQNYRLADTLIQLVSAIIALAVAFSGLLTYESTARNTSLTQQIEQKKLSFEINRQKVRDWISRFI
jgi:hypothetical protein